MTTPTLIGFIVLPFAKVIQPQDATGTQLIARRIGFDAHGGAWALIERWERVGGLRGGAVVRVTLARWQRVAPIPFVDDHPIEIFDGRETADEPVD